MSFKEIAQELIAAGGNKLDIVAYCPLNLCDLLTEEDCKKITESVLKAIDNTVVREKVQRTFAELRAERWEDYTYACAVNWRKLRSEQLMKQHNLQYFRFEPTITRDGNCILVKVEEDVSGSLDRIRTVAEHYGLSVDKPAEAMTDIISVRRLDENTVLGLFGDDRGTSEYWVAVTISPETCLPMFDGSEFGVFA